MSDAEQANQRMVDQMIARGALWSRPLIAAFRATPRHAFLEHVFHYHRRHGWRRIHTARLGPQEVRLVYSDRALTTRLIERPGRCPTSISSSSQPSLMAQMLEDLRLAPGLRVLEVGTGTGYNAALLAHVVGQVVSVDVDREVLACARRHLEGFPDRPVRLHHADGRSGYPPAAPYDRILVTASTPDLEPGWLGQLAEGGLVLAPLDLAPGLSYLVCAGRVGDHFEGRLTRPAYFMPLREEGESGRAEATSAALLPPPESLAGAPAPWAEWSERRGNDHADFLSALAFLAWLEGLTVSYVNYVDSRPTYGVGDLVRGHACWLGTHEWRVTGQAGRLLGERLWETFLDAGGPWPTEFRLRAWPGEGPHIAPGLPGVGSPPASRGPCEDAGRLVFRRRGPRCAQVWEEVEARQRGG